MALKALSEVKEPPLRLQPLTVRLLDGLESWMPPSKFELIVEPMMLRLPEPKTLPLPKEEVLLTVQLMSVVDALLAGAVSPTRIDPTKTSSCKVKPVELAEKTQ